MRCNCATSARRGTLSSTRVCSVSRPAIISGSAAFFAPEIAMVPLSLLPPTMRMRSITIPTVLCIKYTVNEAVMAKARKLRLFDGVSRRFGHAVRVPTRRSQKIGRHPMTAHGVRAGRASDGVDIAALQHRPGIAVARDLDHGAPDLLGRGHVVRCGPIEQAQQR